MPSRSRFVQQTRQIAFRNLARSGGSNDSCNRFLLHFWMHQTRSDEIPIVSSLFNFCLHFTFGLVEPFELSIQLRSAELNRPLH